MKRQKELQEQRIKEGKAVFMVRKAGACEAEGDKQIPGLPSFVPP